MGDQCDDRVILRGRVEILQSLGFGNPVAHILLVEATQLIRQPAPEVVVAPDRRRRPDRLRKGQQTREHHVLGMLGSRDVLGPQLGLCAEYEFFLVLRDLLRHRLIGVGFFQRDEAADTERFEPRIALVVVEVGVLGRRHDDFVILARGLNTPLLTAPRHHDRAWRKASLQNLVPPDHAFPPGVEKPLDAPGEKLCSSSSSFKPSR